MAGDEIDPRYAAQFQRGFDPATAPASATPPSHSTRSAAVRLDGGPLPSAHRVPDPPPLVPRSHLAEPTPDAGEPEPRARTAPMEWALLAAGVLLVVAAGWVFWVSATDIRMYLGAYDQMDFAWVSVRNGLPGPLLVGGVLAISVWLVLRAVRPRR